MEPEGYDPYENIYKEIYNGHHYKAIDMCVPFKYVSEKADNGIKADAVKDNSDNEFLLGKICIRKPENSRQRA